MQKLYKKHKCCFLQAFKGHALESQRLLQFRISSPLEKVVSLTELRKAVIFPIHMFLVTKDDIKPGDCSMCTIPLALSHILCAAAVSAIRNHWLHYNSSSTLPVRTRALCHTWGLKDYNSAVHCDRHTFEEGLQKLHSLIRTCINREVELSNGKTTSEGFCSRSAFCKGTKESSPICSATVFQ